MAGHRGSIASRGELIVARHSPALERELSGNEPCLAALRFLLSMYRLNRCQNWFNGGISSDVSLIQQSLETDETSVAKLFEELGLKYVPFSGTLSLKEIDARKDFTYVLKWRET